MSDEIKLKLNSPKAELRILSSMCRHADYDVDLEIATNLISRANPHLFCSEVTQEIFKVIKTYYAERGQLPKYTYVMDHLLSPDAIKFFKGAGSDLCIDNKADAVELMQLLDDKRCNRLVSDIPELVAKLMQRKGDGAPLLDALLDELLTRKSAHGIQKSTILDIGNLQYESVIEKMLDDKFAGKSNQKFFRTGMTLFDEENEGFPSHEVVLIGANTGAGKSTLACQLSVNFAEFGYLVQLVPLEMSKEMMMDRIMVCAVGKRCGLNMTAVLHNKLTEEQREELRINFASWRKKVNRAGGGIIINKPDGESTMMDVLSEGNKLKVDINLIDYVSLLADAAAPTGNKPGEAAQWQAMGEAVRKSKVHADSQGTCNIVLVQVDESERVRFSQAMKDHAALMWSWVALQKQREAKTGNIIVNINQPKSRHGSPDPIQALIEGSTMNVTQIVSGVAATADVSAGSNGGFGVPDLM